MLFVFSSPPFYTKHVHLPTEHDPTPPEIHNNPKYWPFFKNALGAMDGSHINSSPSNQFVKTERALCHKIAYFVAILVFISSIPSLDGKVLPHVHVFMKMPESMI
jgi:hypothetical protein